MSRVHKLKKPRKALNARKVESRSQSLNDDCLNKVKTSCDELAKLLLAIAHPGRLLILGNLLSGEKSVSELLEQLTLSQSQLSQFLARMKKEKLLKSKRDGRRQIYSIQSPKVILLMHALKDICYSTPN